MLLATLKSLVARRTRLIGSLLAVVLGIAFLSAVLTFNNMINSTLNAMVAGSLADVNVVPQGTYTTNKGAPPSRLITDADLEKMYRVDGVADVVGTLRTTGVYILDQNNKMIGGANSPGMAMNYIAQAAFGNQPSVVIKSGRPPKGLNEVLIDPTSFSRCGCKFGDRISLTSTQLGSLNVVVVGTATWGHGGTAGASYVFYNTRAMQQQFFEGRNEFQSAWVVAKPGRSGPALVSAVAAVAPSGYEAVDGPAASASLSEKTKQDLGFLSVLMLVFACIGLVVSLFLIINTFSIVVAGRISELALLRAMGAKRNQVFRAVLVDAVVLGVVGSVLGILLGWALTFVLMEIMKTAGLDLAGSLPVLTTSTVFVCMIVGMLGTIVAALFPARRAGQIAPITAINGIVPRRFGTDVTIVVGVWLAVIGMGGYLAGLLIKMPFSRLVLIGPSALLTLVGCAMASPLLGKPLSWALGMVFRAGFGEVGKLATNNSARNPRRTAATTSALMIGLTLVTTFAILGSSAQESVHHSVSDELHGDLYVRAAAQGTFPTSVADAIELLPGVATVTRTSTALFVPERGLSKTIATADDQSLNAWWNRTVKSGRVPASAKEVMLSADYAASAKLKEGDRLSGQLAGKSVELRVVGVFSDPRSLEMAALLTPRSTWQELGLGGTDSSAVVTVASPEQRGDVRTAINDLLQKLPMVTVVDKQGYADEQSAQLSSVMNMFSMLLGLAIVISILGIINTLVLSIFERQRETGLLRAVGLTRRQLRTMVSLESIIMASLGAILGMGLGLVFGAGLALSTNKNGVSVIAIPWVQLGIFLGGALIAGMVASIIPAILATRVDMLKAIATD